LSDRLADARMLEMPSQILSLGKNKSEFKMLEGTDCKYIACIDYMVTQKAWKAQAQ